ncbi:MAG: hypothetical protein LRY63_06850 [Nitrincola sp.]|nr:hypothetical protein [Nitrincola sp.]
MSEWFPEKPILVYPSVALRYGVDGALLLSLLDDMFHQLSTSDNKTDMMLLAPGQLQTKVPFWTSDHLSELLKQLQEQGLLQVTLGQNGSIKLSRSAGSRVVSSPEVKSIRAPDSGVGAQSGLQSLPVYDSPPPSPPPKPRRSPAPTFGGNVGWRRGKDELQQIFEQHEERNQRLIPMEMGWKPSESFYEILSRQSITAEFAQQCLDEFILYWLEKDRKETNWDQKFLAWVKREWVRKQTRDAASRLNEQQPSGHVNENTRRDTRENRKRVTASIMDIEDTNW